MSKEITFQSINRDNRSFTVGHNKFSTWTEQEVKAMLGKKKPIMVDTPELSFDETHVLDAEVDWRKKGAVNPVQN